MSTPREKVLYLDDIDLNLELFYRVFRSEFDVTICQDPNEALKIIVKEDIHVVFVDHFMPEISGLDFIEKAISKGIDSIFIILTAHAKEELVIQAMNSGHVHRFLTKPWDISETRVTIKNAFETFYLKQKNIQLFQEIKEKNLQLEELTEKLKEENHYLYKEIRYSESFDKIISENTSFKSILKEIKQVAKTNATVLLLGETGTGKDLAARAVCELSNRKTGPYIKLNCASIPESLIESELFGHEKGAFTGAYRRKIGKFELSEKGTLFLDEIGELPMQVQPKLLHVLQEGTFTRIGGNEEIKQDVRIIAATNRNLEQMIQNGEFRSDLFYRLNIFPIEIPPLRERKNDIPLLVNYFIRKYNRKNGRNVETVPLQIMDKFMNHDWPGNIRELENTIERAVILSKGAKLELKDRFLNIAKVTDSNEILPLITLEKEHILKVLSHSNWKVSGKGGAAEILQMKPTTLQSRMKKLGIKKNLSV